MARIIGIGETVYDIIFRQDQPQQAVPGGSAFNAVISLGRTLGREGTPVCMVTETGDDHIGRLTLQFMQQSHVLTDYVTVNAGTQSHISLAFLNEQNDAVYEFYKDHAHARLNTETFSSSLLDSFSASDYVLFGSFFAINPVLRPHTRMLLQKAHDAGAVLYYDINFRSSHIKDLPEVIGNLTENLRLASVVRGSTEDFGYLYGTTDPREVYLQHIRPCCPCFICTDGAGPIRLFAPNAAQPEGFVEAVIPTAPLPEVVSTIGAGDNFNAGFVYALVHDGISATSLAELSLPQWFRLIESGQRFSGHVCQRICNYVDPGFEPSEN